MHPSQRFFQQSWLKDIIKNGLSCQVRINYQRFIDSANRMEQGVPVHIRWFLCDKFPLVLKDPLLSHFSVTANKVTKVLFLQTQYNIAYIGPTFSFRILSKISEQHSRVKYDVIISVQDMDSKLRHSGRFYIKLKVDEGSKLDNLFLTNNTGIIKNWD